MFNRGCLALVATAIASPLGCNAGINRDPCKDVAYIESLRPRLAVYSNLPRVLALVPSGPGPDVASSPALDLDSLNRVIDAEAGTEAADALIAIVVDSSLPVTGPFERLWTANLLARRDTGAQLIDRALGIVANEFATSGNVDGNALLSIAGLSHAFSQVREGRRTALRGTLLAVCTLSKVHSVSGAPDKVTVRSWMRGTQVSVLTGAAADLVLALERFDSLWASRDTKALLAHWDGMIALDSLEARLEARSR